MWTGLPCIQVEQACLPTAVAVCRNGHRPYVHQVLEHLGHPGLGDSNGLGEGNLTQWAIGRDEEPDDRGCPGAPFAGTRPGSGVSSHAARV